MRTTFEHFQRSGHRGQTGCERKSAGAAFQVGDATFVSQPRRVNGARVIVAFVLARTFLNVCRRCVNRRHDRASEGSGPGPRESPAWQTRAASSFVVQKSIADGADFAEKLRTRQDYRLLSCRPRNQRFTVSACAAANTRAVGPGISPRNLSSSITMRHDHDRNLQQIMIFAVWWERFELIGHPFFTGSLPCEGSRCLSRAHRIHQDSHGARPF